MVHQFRPFSMAQAILHGLKLCAAFSKAWRYVIGDITIPTQQSEESKEKLQDHLEDWDNKNHQATTWFHNSCVPSINVQFGRYETTKEVRDLLASQYTTADLVHQLVVDFLSQMQSLWDQLAFFEPVRAFLLHRVPLPSLENAIAELISEETRPGIGKNNHFTDAILAVPPSSTTNQSFCKFCHQSGHMTKDCTKLLNFTCQHCHQKSHYSSQYYKKRSGSHPSQFSPHHSAVVTSESSSDFASATSTGELESLLKQFLSKTSSPSTALSVTPGRKCGRLFQLTSLQLLVPKSSSPHLVGSTPSRSTSNIWHSRLGHPSSVRLRSLISSGHLGIVSDDMIDCVSCQLAK
ncbi:hypothetical protein NE237_025117 [Protea cynaroides]|uniref:CCHC-type domain-containing protein n=1 Tax=Protea cynaroides TaxID=273540 RepID=A0A9Q0JZU8_9MAGN|nr:hypothetical protein NE237_025117 [Protea cynaroides]